MTESSSFNSMNYFNPPEYPFAKITQPHKTMKQFITLRALKNVHTWLIGLPERFVQKGQKFFKTLFNMHSESLAVNHFKTMRAQY